MTTSPPRVAVVGATGAVGLEFLRVLEARRFPMASLRLLASARSAGKRLEFGGEELVVEELADGSFRDVDLALFSAGGSISKSYAPIAVAEGATVVDNSSAFRMDAAVPLIVPEVNGHVLDDWSGPGIIANPNCSTIIALLPVTPLHRQARVLRMVVATYQAVSGGGAAMMSELEQQARDWAAGRPLDTSVAGRQGLFNVYSHNSSIGADGQNEEERKLLRETRKIWDDREVRISATCMRVPVLRSHTEAINLEFAERITPEEARAILADAPGVRVVEDPERNRYPEPIHASGRDEILVGRIRADESIPDGRGLNLLVCGDQLLKGAALNAVQIAERLAGVAALSR